MNRPRKSSHFVFHICILVLLSTLAFLFFWTNMDLWRPDVVKSKTGNSTLNTLVVRKAADQENLTSTRIHRNLQVPDLTFQCSDGELGNRMFYYAVVYGISRLNNRKGFIQRCNTRTCTNSENYCSRTSLDKIFHFNLPVRPDLPHKEQQGHSIRFHLRFPEDYNIAKKVNVLTGESYPVSVTYFLHVREEIRREFNFREEYKVYANRVLQQAKSSRNSSTFIGVHVRRGSYLSHLMNSQKAEASPEFFQFGLRYYRLNYKDAVFVVLSNDLPWCRTRIIGEDVFIPEKMGSQEQDLAVLSSCQHSLFDYGTYGFWGAFLAGGQALYFVDGIIDPTINDTTLAKVMYPPEWIGISLKMLKVLQ